MFSATCPMQWNIMVELKIVQFINSANSAFSMPLKRRFFGFKSSRGIYFYSFFVCQMGGWNTNTSHQPASALWVLKPPIFILHGIYGSAKVNLPCSFPKKTFIAGSLHACMSRCSWRFAAFGGAVGRKTFPVPRTFCCDGTFKQFSLGWAVEKSWVVATQRFFVFIPKFGEDSHFG